MFAFLCAHQKTDIYIYIINNYIKKGGGGIVRRHTQR